MNIEIKTTNKGAELTSLKVNSKEILHDGKTFWNRQAPILFPIVGSLKDDKTIIYNKEYEMSQHGFARNMEFKCISMTDKKHSYLLTSNNETLIKYPFDFELYVDYTIQTNGIDITYTVVNNDEKTMYFGIGAHPAFKCDYTNNLVEVEFENEENNIEFYRLNDKLLDTKKSDNILYNKKTIKVTKDLFDLDALIMTNISSNKVSLKQNGEKLLSFEFKNFPYFAIWSKKDAPFICLEPWFNTADKVDTNGELKSKDNILTLKPKEKFNCSYKITF